MKRHWRHLTVLSGFLIGLAFAASQEQPFSLRLKYQPGQTLNYKITLEGKTNLLSEIGVATDLQFKGELTQEQVVKEVADDGTATLQVTIGGKMTLSMPVAGAQSGEQKVPPMTFLMKLTPSGEITEIKSLKSEGEKLPEQLQAIQDPMQLLTLGATARFMFQVSLPPKPIKVGETWEFDGTVPALLPIGKSELVKMSVKGKLVSVERKDGNEMAVLEVQSEIPEIGELIAKSSFWLKEMGIDLQAKGGTKAEAKYWFDLAKGLVTRSEIDTDTKLLAVIQMPENVGGSVMNLQSQTKIKTLIELVATKP